VPRFYSPEWVEAFNRAVDGLDVVPDAGSVSLAAASGSFRVAQVVHGGPDGELTVALEVADGRLRLALAPVGDAQGDVIVLLSYDDAAAMARGQLDPGTAVAEGRVRVRGDLAVLVASQALLVAAASRLAGLQADTTY
jgi:putative sterol carrier protein